MATENLLLVEGGDFFSRIPVDRRNESIAAWREMERLGYAAVALGDLELKQWPLTDSLINAGPGSGHTPLPLVTTNIERRDGDGWRPVGERVRVVEIAGVRIAFLSALPEGRISAHALEQAAGELRLLPALATTREVTRLVKTGAIEPTGPRILDGGEARRLAGMRADLVVLLGYLDLTGFQTFADSIPEIDVILGGMRQARDNGPVRIGTAIANRSGDRGAAVAVTDLVIAPDNRITALGGVNAVLEEAWPEAPAVAAACEAAKEASDAARAARLQAKRALGRERRGQAREEEQRRLEAEGANADSSSRPAGDPPGAAVRHR